MLRRNILLVHKQTVGTHKSLYNDIKYYAIKIPTIYAKCFLSICIFRFSFVNENKKSNKTLSCIK